MWTNIHVSNGADFHLIGCEGDCAGKIAIATEPGNVVSRTWFFRDFERAGTTLYANPYVDAVCGTLRGIKYGVPRFHFYLEIFWLLRTGSAGVIHRLDNLEDGVRQATSVACSKIGIGDSASTRATCA